MISRRSLLTAGIATGLASRASLGAARESRVLQVVSPREITSLEPRDTGFHFRRLRVAECLVTIDPTGKLVGELAESWHVSADGKTWRFKIRPGVRFHDGTTASPEIIRQSFERLRPTSELVATAPIEKVTAEGDELVFGLTTQFSLLPAYLTDATAIILAPVSFDARGMVRQVIGTGPYRAVKIIGRDAIDLEAFADYWGPQPHIAKVRFAAAKTPDALANLAESGQADLTFSVPLLLKNRIESSGRTRVIVVPTARTLTLRLNVADPLFSDVRVRRALSLAVDRTGIATALYANPTSVANQLVSNALPEWHDRSIPQARRDVDGARALLEQAGWKPGADGILQKNGGRFVFNLFTGPDPEWATLGQALQDQFREIGIEAVLEPGKWSVLLDKVKTNTDQANIGARNYAQVPDAIATLRVDYSAETAVNHVWGGRNFMAPELDGALHAYLAATTPDARTAARRSIQDILVSGLPAIPITYRDYGVAVSKRIAPGSVVVDPLEFSFWIDRIRWAT
ncbi:ABC transporter substrate-binding protein [Bradyrhizobium sp. USDA 10063]